MKCNKEVERLAFMESRDGKEEAIFFAKQSVTQYIRALQTPYGKEYRVKLIESIYSFMEYLRDNQ